MDNELAEMTGIMRPNALIIPTAAAAERPMLAAENGIRQFDLMGARASSLMALNSTDANDEDLTSAVDSADIIYLTGGNPAHLLQALRGSLLLQRMLDAVERGAILAGSSAGAMVMGERMRFRQWLDALRVTPGLAVLPHHERASKSQTSRDVSVQTAEGLAVLGIDGATGCVSDGDGWRVLGAGSATLYRVGDWNVYRAGEYFETA
jgi:cyanophycinase